MIGAARAALALVFLAGSAAAAQPLRCPPGTAAWVDGWGNPTCRSLDTGESVLTAPNPRTGLPSGFVRSFDGWGNPVARSVGPDAGTSYLPTSWGCPVGTSAWRDAYGNPACRPLLLM